MEKRIREEQKGEEKNKITIKLSKTDKIKWWNKMEWNN